MHRKKNGKSNLCSCCDGGGRSGGSFHRLRGLLRLRLFLGCLLLGRSSSTLGWVFKRSDRSGLLNLRRMLINLSGGGDLGLGFRLEEITDASRESAADLGSLGGLLLLFLLLFLLLLRVQMSDRKHK